MTEAAGATRLRPVGAVLFDMDGTLVDSRAAVERAWATWAREHGADVDQAVRCAHGGSAEDLVRLLLPGLTDREVDAGAARQLELQYDDVADVVAARGAREVVELVEELALPWAVVTNADLRLAQVRLRAAGVRAPVLVTVEDVPAGKPDPAGYRLAASRLGVPTSACLVVEDSAAGASAGRAAGAQVAGVGGLEADVTVADLVELGALVRSAAARGDVIRAGGGAAGAGRPESRWRSGS
ncbi:HAD family hydrolase [Quadrisphaera oryzae]|uniref:HAD family hydrolase n=1 Tax=Quadrisphaera TaxID=317661 RepID=UPI001C95FEF9